MSGRQTSSSRTWEDCRKVYTAQRERYIGCVSDIPSGFRDVVWCPYANEPTFLVSDEDGNPDCPLCAKNFEPETHPFILHVLKPGAHS